MRQSHTEFPPSAKSPTLSVVPAFMPGISFLDSITDYGWASGISTAITVVAVLSGISFVGTVVVAIVCRESDTKQARVTKAILGVAFAFMVVVCVLYQADGRYSIRDVSNLSDPGKTYIGQTKNNTMDGFGKLFDSDRNIEDVASWKGGKLDGWVSHYKTDESLGSFLAFEGGYADGRAQGEGTSYEVAGGAVRMVYKGTYEDGSFSGEGHYCSYDEDTGKLRWEYDGMWRHGELYGYGKRTSYAEDGSLSAVYEGCWANGSRHGCGVETEYVDGKVDAVYEGNFWEGERYGGCVYEYTKTFDDGSSANIVWCGNWEGNKQTKDGMYYYADGSDLPTESNGTRVKQLDGSTVTDEKRLTELKEHWPFPDHLNLF